MMYLLFSTAYENSRMQLCDRTVRPTRMSARSIVQPMQRPTAELTVVVVDEHEKDD